MNIIEATKEAIKQERRITRQSFIDMGISVRFAFDHDHINTSCYFLRKPTPNAPLGHRYRESWEPQTADILADDWVLID